MLEYSKLLHGLTKTNEQINKDTNTMTRTKTGILLTLYNLNHSMNNTMKFESKKKLRYVGCVITKCMRV